ncbi:MAG: metallophosphoesterase family protein [Bdellovibrionales bacterium]
MSKPHLLAIGDIHGCFQALLTLEQLVPFGPADQLITLGDYVDRGPKSREVLDWLIARNEQGRLIALRGNHDIMMMESRFSRTDRGDWLRAGGNTTLASYGSPEQPGTLEDIPDEHWNFLESVTLPWWLTPTHIFVHANLYPSEPMEDQPEFMLFWERIHIQQEPHYSGKTVICGHSSQKSGLPLNLGHTICIDTRVYDHGWLTCLEVETGHYWQANELGEFRTGKL